MDSKVLNQLARYCAYQERCISEIKQKMKDLLVDESDYANYLTWLSENNYLNEARFVELYVRSKFNQKHWGRNKIMFELKKRGIIRTNNLIGELGEYFVADILIV